MTIRFVPTHIESALGVVATERERTKAERNAFTRFADRINDFETTSREPDLPHGPSVTPHAFESHSGSDTTFAQIRDVYREIVMNVPHYDEEYGESLREHLAMELSPEIAITLTTDSHNRFTPSLQDGLITESRTAAADRDTFLTELKTETNALETADEQLTTLGESLNCLLDTRSLNSWSQSELTNGLSKLHTTEQECEELSADRQATLQTSRLPSFQRVDFRFEEYLYQSLSVTYPILADISSLLQTLDSLKSDVSHALDTE